MNVFDYYDYKLCVNDWVSQQPRGGHGLFRQLSLHLGINSVVISQVFRGDREITLEQAIGVSEFLGLTEVERDYFLLLVQKSRAGSVKLISIFEKQIQEARKSAEQLKNRVKHQKLSDEDRATFYSQWYYSAIRLGISIPDFGTVSKIAEHLKLDRLVVAQVMDFLIKNNLIIDHDGSYDLGPQVTHVGHDSPFVNRHHTNWRLKAMQSMEHITETDLFYTGPMVLSHTVAQEIRKALTDLISKSTKKVAVSESEVLRCLNIDWFGIGDKKHL
jgi:uncharacterized protein (TIGR02147 family)